MKTYEVPFSDPEVKALIQQVYPGAKSRRTVKRSVPLPTTANPWLSSTVPETSGVEPSAPNVSGIRGAVLFSASDLVRHCHSKDRPYL